MADAFADLATVGAITDRPLTSAQAEALMRLAAIYLATQPGLPEQPWFDRLHEAAALLYG